jgi:hypothetical protein
MRRVSDLKAALRRAGVIPPYLGELTRGELHKWIAKYMTDKEAEYVFEVIRRDEAKE